MGRRYYCDYCDKTFIDEVEARKKHLSSSHHIRLRKLHYEVHRDPQVILAEESVKPQCTRFMRHGDCQFTVCKYTHYTQEELWNIKRQIEYVQYEKKHKQQEVPVVPSLESWLDKYNGKHDKVDKKERSTAAFWTYPEHLEYRPDLPPSLKKFKPEDFVNSAFEEWGK